MAKSKNKWTLQQHKTAADSLRRMQNSITLFTEWMRETRKLSTPAGRRLQRLCSYLLETRADFNLKFQNEYPNEWDARFYFPEITAGPIDDDTKEDDQ